MANIINYYVDMWRKFADFSGRTDIPGYWWASLVNFVITTILRNIPYVGGLYALAVLIPGLSITVRRLNDCGKHWAWIFINCIPLVGQIIFIIMLCKPSVDNKVIDAL